MKNRAPILPRNVNKTLASKQVEGRVRRLAAPDIFADAEEVIIDYAGQSYRLRITRNGKLILTK